MDGLGIQVTLGQPDVTPAPDGPSAASRSPRSSWAASSRRRRRAADRRGPRVTPTAPARLLRLAGALAGSGGLGASGAAGLRAPTRRRPVGAIARGRRRQGPGGLPLARPDPSGDAPDLRATTARSRRACSPRRPAAAVLQLDRVHQPGRHQILPAPLQGQGEDQHVHDDRRGRREAGERRGVPSTSSCPRLVFLEELVVGKIPQPLNHSPTCRTGGRDVWPSLTEPLV